MVRPLLLAASLALLSACGGKAVSPPKAEAEASRQEPVALPPEIADYYRRPGARPIWVAGAALRPEALDVIARIGRAADQGLDPEAYDAAALARAAQAARGGDRQALAHAELLLSRAFTAFAHDLRGPGAAGGMKHIDPGLKPEAPSPRALLEALAAAPSLRDGVAEALRMNPLYESLSRGYAQWRSGAARPAAEEALIRANLERARAIPASGGRYIIVDAASARLWMVEGDRVEAPMRVIVGKTGMQTPAMAGLIRYVTLNPYWNMPPDLARDRARRVLRKGSGVIAAERLQILSDWGDSPRVLKASQVDWGAVASGRRALRLRQLPGGANVMGAVKFMLPNELGIYLHDFPDKSLFARSDRRLSSGCVRLSEAPRLANWLFRGHPPRPQGPAPEQDVDLPEPVPVYITYLTILPGAKGGLTFQPDAYGRDRSLSASARRAGKGAAAT
jgi:murein L,D-transpeptidase YcbB/YkuD